MLIATKSHRFNALFSRYNEWYLIRRQFRSFHIRGELDPESSKSESLLYIMNHSSWWDGLIMYFATQKTSIGDHYMMMEQRQLEKYAFFRKVGAYSIDRDHPGDIRASFRYTSELLKVGKRPWMFPQGSIYHLESRPMAFQPGVGLLLRQNPDVSVVPVTLYHGLFQHAKPDVTMLVGKPVKLSWNDMSNKEISLLLEEKLQYQLDGHRSDVITSPEGIPEGYQSLFRVGKSTNEKWDTVKAFLKIKKV